MGIAEDSTYGKVLMILLLVVFIQLWIKVAESRIKSSLMWPIHSSSKILVVKLTFSDFKLSLR